MGISSHTPPLTAKQIIAKLNAAGFTADQQESLMLIWQEFLRYAFVQRDEGLPIPETTNSLLDDFDPDADTAQPEG